MKRPRARGPRPANFLALMESRAPTDDEERDYFPTPPWAARAGGELARRLDPAAASCWEPACGAGHMVHGLADYFEAVFASDIEPRALPWPGRAPLVHDFVGSADAPVADVDWIITNPPFVIAEDFVRLGLRHAERGVAVLCRLAFLETIDRYALHYGQTPLGVVAPFAERVPMAKGKWDPAGSTATAYAWFVWLTPAARAASPFGAAIEAANGLGAALCLGLAPGACDRLTRQSDFDRFAAQSSPLFDQPEKETGDDPPTDH